MKGVQGIMQNSKTLAKISDMWDKRKYELIAKASVIPGFLLAQQRIFATQLEITQNASTTFTNLLSDLSALYCKSLCWLLFLGELLVYVFSKDDKKIALARKCFYGSVIVYIFFKLVGTDGGVIASTADKVSDWMGGK